MATESSNPRPAGATGPVATGPGAARAGSTGRAGLDRPLVAITLGDPAGIGPEIVVKALMDEEVYHALRPLVIGDRSVVERARRLIAGAPAVRVVADPAEGLYTPGTLDLVDLANVPPDLALGQIQAAAGRAAYQYIERAVAWARTGRVDAVATAPIHKEALRAAGVPHIGHTEIFAELTGSPDPLTMFEVAGIRIFFLTRHVSLRQALDLVRKERIVATARAALGHLQALGIAAPRLAVAALNPHAGDGGLLGREEIEEIAPAVAQLQQEGHRVLGPVPADSVFHLARQGAFDAVLSLYHDQGHIAAKSMDFEGTVSVTLGLPFIRTSVDHGTAFDIAGTGKASAVSMKRAILAAGRLAGLGRSSRPAAAPSLEAEAWESGAGSSGGEEPAPVERGA